MSNRSGYSHAIAALGLLVGSSVPVRAADFAGEQLPNSYVSVLFLLALPATLIGIFLFLYARQYDVSLWAALVDSVRSKVPTAKRVRTTEPNPYIVLSMLAVALADAQLEEKEVQSISRIYKAVTGTTLPAAKVHEMANMISTSETSVYSELSRIENRMSPTLKAMIMTAAYLVLIADGESGAFEHNRIVDIAQALKVPYERAVTILRQAHAIPMARGMDAVSTVAQKGTSMAA